MTGDRSSAPRGCVRVRGARQHNLKNISFDLPLDTLTVVTGVSGSGKSSLAFDTLYAEGQRRYVESFSAYARQFLDRMDKPKADLIDGIPPAIAIDRAARVKSSRSTVGTMTEINDYLKLLFPRIGLLHCRACGRPVRRETPELIARELYAAWPGQEACVCFPLRVTEKSARAVAEELAKLGFVRRYADGAVVEIGAGTGPEPPGGEIQVVADRLTLVPRARPRLTGSIEQALHHGSGKMTVFGPGGAARKFSRALHCAECDISYADPAPHLFSFNSPLGACPACRGFGRTIGVDLDAVIPDPKKSIRDGALKPFNSPSYREGYRNTLAFCARRGIPADIPFDRLSPEHRKLIFDGEGDYYGIRGFFEWLEGRTYRLHVRVLLSRYRAYSPCPACGGKRLREEGLLHRVNGLTIADIWDLPVGNACGFFTSLGIPDEKDKASALLREEILSRLRYLADVGLDYLTLGRQSRTLSAGETQRVNLTSALGSRLVNALYVLDEPSVGLHPRDSRRLLAILRGLTERRNTAVVVEHDPEIIRGADHVLDMGPGAGGRGGEIVYRGGFDGLLADPRSLTGRYLSGAARIEIPSGRRPFDPQRVVRIEKAAAHNLKKIDVDIPLGMMVCVTGVSGSGKSSLVEEVLYKGLRRVLGGAAGEPGRCVGIRVLHHISDVILVDQSAVVRSPRANTATWMGAWGPIRGLFASTPPARARGLSPSWFSFNVPGGRCAQCAGEGFEKVEMQFLADAFVRCPECGGSRFGPEARGIRLRGKSVVEVLAMTVGEARGFFADTPGIAACLDPLAAVGLGYLALGQPLSTLSGGEAQRLKLARHMAEGAKGDVLFIFDEPTTGLHYDDIRLLVEALQNLVLRGNSLLIVEHNMELVKCADYVIDLGPEGGEGGGQVVARGTPEEVAARTESRTAPFLAACLRGEAPACREQPASFHAAAKPAPPAITVTGAREHNLKNIRVAIPRDRFVVLTGPSGSGKSTLAFDVVFAEGQRLYLESLSAYVRQYVTPAARPDADSIEGLPPTIAVEQRVARGGARSTVATMTEVYHYLRLLFAKTGVQHCPGCGVAIEPRSPEMIAAAVAARYRGRGVTFLAPLVRGRKGIYRELIAAMEKKRHPGLRIDGTVHRYRSASPPPASLDRYREHDIDLVIGAMKVGGRGAAEFRKMIDAAIEAGAGTFSLLSRGMREAVFSSARSCARCGKGFDELDPRFFSFNSRRGACPECEGMGFRELFCEALLVPDEGKSLAGGALAVHEGGVFRGKSRARLGEFAKRMGIPRDAPFRTFTRAQRRRLLHGQKGIFEGVIPHLDRMLAESDNEALRNYLARFREEFVCGACGGKRLKPEWLAVRVAGRSIADYHGMDVNEALGVFSRMRSAGRPARRLQGRGTHALRVVGGDAELGDEIVKEIVNRLGFIREVGLPYLALGRRADTLSGGEAQRLRLAAQLGSRLRGACYVLDEPTIGIHPRDNALLINAFRKLRDAGNTVLVVEHDEETIRSADHIIDLGPGGGSRGGEVVAEGGLDRIRRAPGSLTAQWLADPARKRPHHPKRRVSGKRALVLGGVTHHNLRGITARFPAGAFTCVTGVSGAGKSSLVFDTLLPAVRKALGVAQGRIGAHAGLAGAELFDRVMEVDPSPIGRTPRSTAATYVGFWEEIRSIFALSPEARIRGYGKERFSFNRAQGQCPECKGAGRIKVEMSFLPDVHVHCETCGGKRYSESTLEVTYRGRTIADILAMTIEEAAEFFEPFPKVRGPLAVMEEIGLGYLTLGQPSTMLSGGESQRVKIACELAAPPRGNTLYILDEPTIGLHMADIQKLLAVLQRLVDAGNTVVVIEHNPDVIKEADWVIDLGPEGGPKGGRVVFQGPFDRFLAASPRSHTARFLKKQLRQ
ncbi:MAG: excinuclease ABC subunit UvrA [Chlamydiota bacterium]